MENRGAMCLMLLELVYHLLCDLFAGIHVHDYRCAGVTVGEVQAGHYGGKLDKLAASENPRPLPWLDFKICVRALSSDLVPLERVM